MEPMEGDPLVSLGLVDPRGNAVPTVDWSGPDSNHPGSADGTNDRPANPASEPQPLQQNPAAGTQPAGTAGQATINWDDPSNPYRPDPSAQATQLYQSRVAALDAERPAAVALLMAQNYPQNVAEAMVASLHAAAVANVKTEADRIAMLPYAKQASAEDIAKKLSTSAVTIDPKELLTEPTPEAMQAKARTIVNERRDRVVNQRAANGADRVERVGTTATVDYSQLSPHSMISLGLRRGQ
jgi:hypothetical protein